MIQKDLNSIISQELQYCLQLLNVKSSEYATDFDDRLEAFKRAAALENQPAHKSLLGMLTKHTVSIAMMCEKPVEAYNIEKWIEKISDSINYHLLLLAVVHEAQEELKYKADLDTKLKKLEKLEKLEEEPRAPKVSEDIPQSPSKPEDDPRNIGPAPAASEPRQVTLADLDNEIEDIIKKGVN